jgi:hypothetical protein
LFVAHKNLCVRYWWKRWLKCLWWIPISLCNATGTSYFNKHNSHHVFSFRRFTHILLIKSPETPFLLCLGKWIPLISA